MIYLVISCAALILAYFIYLKLYRLQNRASSNNLKKQHANVQLAFQNKNTAISTFNLLYDHCKKEFLEYNIQKNNQKILIKSKLLNDHKESIIAEISLNKDKPKYKARHNGIILIRYPNVPTRQQLREDIIG